MVALKGVLFDAGGTLVQVHTDRLADELRTRGADPGDLSDAFWRTLVGLDAELGTAGIEFTAWYPRFLKGFAEASALPEDLVAEAWRAADERQHLWDDPISGAHEALTRLGEAGLRLGVVSNSDGRVEAALRRAALADFFEVIVDSGVVGVAKPDPRIFDFALGPLELAPEETWYLGDTVMYDAAAADAAGLTSWVIDHRGLHTVAHPRRVATLGEFADAAIAAAKAG
jgi:HAD superfamily hydrolase (TIGR01549 family)